MNFSAEPIPVKTWLKPFLLILLGLGLLFGSLWLLTAKKDHWPILSPLGQGEPSPSAPRPLEKYAYENLKKRGGQPSQIKLEKVLGQYPGFTAWLFSYISEGRKITGLAHIPQGSGPFPVIVMVRGYVDREIYQTGVGTRPAGQVYAENGLATFAPDFLGYGQSDRPPENIWEDRFLKVVAVTDLLASIASSSAELNLDQGAIGLWGHSNGGMVSLSTLEITGKAYPTVLWAPVSQFFPYDILFYTWEQADKGRWLRYKLAQFEQVYQVDDYSFDEYLDWIKAPFQIHQGTADQYIPVWWSDNLVNNLKNQGLKVDYYLYEGADHQLSGAWDTVVARNLEFYQEHLK